MRKLKKAVRPECAIYAEAGGGSLYFSVSGLDKAFDPRLYDLSIYVLKELRQMLEECEAARDQRLSLVEAGYGPRSERAEP